MAKKLIFKNGRPTYVDVNEKIRTDTDKKYNDFRRDNQSDYVKFYKSTAWKHLRDEVMQRDFNLCQRCGLQAKLIDHIVPSEDDWEDRLNAKWLQALCQDCHNAKTRREYIKRSKGVKRSMQITVVTGYPGSGKSRYVDEHKDSHTLIYDYERLMQSLSGLPLHENNMDVYEYAQLMFELILKKIKSEKTFSQVFLVLDVPDEKTFTMLSSLPNVKFIYLSTSKVECRDRLLMSSRTFNSNSFERKIKQIDLEKDKSYFKAFQRV